MTWFRSLITAIATYSKIPVPHIAWKEENLRYVLCFFPFVGAVIGAAVFGICYGAAYLTNYLIGQIAVICVVPVLITGGIHLDGMIDTQDALCSYAPREKKLEILKDPHVGAFGVIHCVVYFILYACAAFALDLRGVGLVALSFTLSRALSAVSAVTWRSAKEEGSLYTLKKASAPIATIVISSVWAAAAISGMLAIDWFRGLLCVAGAVIAWGTYRFTAYRRFGGITGDLAGWFVQRCELFVVIAAAMGGLMERWIW